MPGWEYVPGHDDEPDVVAPPVLARLHVVPAAAGDGGDADAPDGVVSHAHDENRP
jgi:hypothetical protein